MILKLTLKKKWFDMILSGEKVTEYRELKPYWVQRIFDYKDIDATPESFLEALITKQYPMFLYTKRFTKVQFYNGAYFSDKLPHFTVDYTGLQIGEGVEDWGAEKGVDYLCISFANVHDCVNC
jgi:hypothetical protein